MSTRLSVRGAVVFVFAIVVMTVAGVAFVYKMTEFALTIVRDQVEGFGAVAVGTYLIGMLPIVFVTLWAILTGRFRDIERPKFRMLELDREIERGGELDPEAPMDDERDRPIVAPGGASPASASRPDNNLDPHWHTYEANPAPWWIAVAWLGFFVFGVIYLISNLLE